MPKRVYTDETKKAALSYIRSHPKATLEEVSQLYCVKIPSLRSWIYEERDKPIQNLIKLPNPKKVPFANGMLGTNPVSAKKWTKRIQNLVEMRIGFLEDPNNIGNPEAAKLESTYVKTIETFRMALTSIPMFQNYEEPGESKLTPSEQLAEDLKSIPSHVLEMLLSKKESNG